MALTTVFKWLSFSLYKTVISIVEPSSCSRWTVGFKLNWKLFATLPAHLEPVGIASGGISKTVHRKLKKSQKINCLSDPRRHTCASTASWIQVRLYIVKTSKLVCFSTVHFSVHYQLIWKLQFSKEHLFREMRKFSEPTAPWAWVLHE